jgi:hypothetical protein
VSEKNKGPERATPSGPFTSPVRVEGLYSDLDNHSIAPHPDSRQPLIEERVPKLNDWEPLADGDIRRNGGARCDMKIGPCSCGAWHAKDFEEPAR